MGKVEHLRLCRNQILKNMYLNGWMDRWMDGWMDGWIGIENGIMF